MNFYKMKSIDNGKEIYLNPKLIICYYNEDITKESNVIIIFNGGDYVTVSKSDFTNMLILEGIDEYWQTPLLTEYPSIIKIKLFYSQNLWKNANTLTEKTIILMEPIKLMKKLLKFIMIETIIEKTTSQQTTKQLEYYLII